MQKCLTQNKTRAFLRKLLKGSRQYVKEYCRRFISKITEEEQMRLIPRCITLDWWIVIFLWEPYFHHFYVVAKMIRWVKNLFFGWILNINYFKKLNIFSDSHMSFKETHVVTSDKRSHISIVIVLLH